jgi:hypothetical protein
MWCIGRTVARVSAAVRMIEVSKAKLTVTGGKKTPAGTARADQLASAETVRETAGTFVSSAFGPRTERRQTTDLTAAPALNADLRIATSAFLPVVSALWEGSCHHRREPPQGVVDPKRSFTSAHLSKFLATAGSTLAARSRLRSRVNLVPSRRRTSCSWCAELIQPEAKICPHCSVCPNRRCRKHARYSTGDLAASPRSA